MTDFEFYETPETFTRYLFDAVPIAGVIVEPCVGSGAIVRAGSEMRKTSVWSSWLVNDLDPAWEADYHLDATANDIWNRVVSRSQEAFRRPIDWTVTNPPFSGAIGILDRALYFSQVGVAMHLRASIHEVLKTGIRRTWMAQHTPTGILWLPRFAYQRSKSTGLWATDSVCACWVIWLKDPAAPQFIRYAPAWVLDALEAETPEYRKRMDALMAQRAA